MTSYDDDDQLSAAQGRARVPGSGGAPVEYEIAPGNAGYAPPPPTTAGRASVIPEQIGSPVGRASVPGPTASPTGRASVDTPPNRTGPNGPNGPAGAAGPAQPGKPPVDKKKRRRNRILAAFAVLIMLSGLLVVVITYYAESIPTPESLPLPQSTIIEYSNGQKMAQIGQVTRESVPLSSVPVPIRQAVVATEDKTFYQNSGVDVKGIARAFINNVQGKETQGGSTITQQYARYVAGLTYGQSYTRKVREVVIAVKLTERYSKDEILTDYLNTVLFGRGAYGIQAAAQAYFGKDVKNLSLAQGMVLAGLIKDPNGQVFDPAYDLPDAKDRWGYTRGQMVDDGMITQAQADALQYPTDWLPPKSVDQNAIQGINTPTGFIVHHVMDELSNLKKADGSPLFPVTGPDASNSLLNGGYTIKTTIDQSAENAAIAAAGPTGPMKDIFTVDKGKKTKEAASALVAVQPGTGRVLAYYGGQNGANFDYAGIYDDPVTTKGGLSGGNVIPGSTFKTITMATALSQGISMHSYWYGPTTRHFASRGGDISNTPSDDCPGVGHICQMWQALQHSTNTVFYAIGDKVGVGNILDMAYNLGINHVWSDSECANANGLGKRIDLTAGSGASHTNCIRGEVAFGEFGVTVQDVANVMATLANHGTKANEHFVDSVTQGFDNTAIYKAKVALTPVPKLTSAMVDDETWAMQQVFTNPDEQDNQLAGGREAAVKTGTWQLGDSQLATKTEGAMFNGFTAGDAAHGQIAASVWIGDSGTRVPVYYGSTSHNLGGSSAPADVWQKFIDAYEKGKPLEKFAAPSGTGSTNDGERPSPSPSASPTASTGPSTPACPNPLGCGTSTGPTTGPTASSNPSEQPSAAPSPADLSAAASAQGRTVTVSFDNTGGETGPDQGDVEINWGDGSSQPSSKSHGQSKHQYNKGGTYKITVTDQDSPSRSWSTTVTVS